MKLFGEGSPFQKYPKTKLGSVLRWLLLVMVIAHIALYLFSYNGKLFFYYPIYQLLFYAEMTDLLALSIIAVRKRANTKRSRMWITIVLALISTVVIVVTVTPVAMNGEYTLKCIDSVSSDTGTHPTVLLRSYTTVNPDGSEFDGTKLVGTTTYDADIYTAEALLIPAGETATVTGEIIIPSTSKYNVQIKINSEWTDEKTLRIFIETDDSGYGHGEINVSFAENTAAPTEAELDTGAEPTSEARVFQVTLTNTDATRSVSVYHEPSTMDVPTTGVTSIDDYPKAYNALPRWGSLFYDLTRNVEGEILVDSRGTLIPHYEWPDADTLHITPGEGSIGASGEITIRYNEPMPQTSAEPADAPSDAPADAPADAPTDAPADAPTDAPADAPTDTPADAN